MSTFRFEFSAQLDNLRTVRYFEIYDYVPRAYFSSDLHAIILTNEVDGCSLSNGFGRLDTSVETPAAFFRDQAQFGLQCHGGWLKESIDKLKLVSVEKVKKVSFEKIQNGKARRRNERRT